MRTLTLMPDYGCHPLWEQGGDAVGEVDPASLPIPDALRERLHAWAAAYDTTLAPDDPAASGFASPEDEAAFEREGRRLWRALQGALGDAYTVRYFSEREGRLLDSNVPSAPFLSRSARMDRLDRIREALAEHDADARAVLLTSLPNIRWATGFTGSNARLLVTPDGAAFLTDGRYDAQAHTEVQNATVHIVRGSLNDYTEANDLLDGLDRVAVQGDDLTVSTFDTFTERFPGVAWVPVRGLLNAAVAQKTDAEVDRIRSAQRITETVFREILDVLEPGRTEKEVAAEIVYRHLRHGAEKMAFDPIVASGPNAALPHARPTGRTLCANELVLIDMGGVVDGYASDMTRTVALGDPGDRARQLYALVQEAQTEALHAARAGIASDELDAAARDVFDAAGLKDAFAHGLGHGVGLEIHEWPRVSYTVSYDLPAGACVTIEPGVYLPDEGIGIRIEDLVVLREGGAENLTTAPKDLLVL